MDSMRSRISTYRAWIAAVLVALGTATLFWPALDNGFIDLYDDGPYVLHNQTVRAGFTADGIAWAFSSVHVHNWHPLTWISHMVDVEFFGLDPRGHHLTSVLLHAANAGLVVLLFAALGAPVVAAAMAGALFGAHPLRLQSVAWIAERKDVLSGLFFLLSLLAWVLNARRPNRGAYLASLGTFALGLLAKPMLVTTPAVFLLLDFWPLHRVKLGGGPEERVRWKAEGVRLTPFVVLSVLVAAATVLVQGSSGSFAAGAGIPLGERLANAATSIFAYLSKMVWPSDLSVFYPHPRRAILSPLALLAGGGIALATAGAAVAWRRAPWLLVGWLWFLAMLLPVSGILQVGKQGMADRYTYLPGLGILLALTFTVLASIRRVPGRWRGIAMATASAFALAALALATRADIRFWRDSETLFLHAREATPQNALASNALGTIAAGRGQFGEAERLFRESIAADAEFGIPRQNLAAMLLQQGRLEEGWPQALEAVRPDPSNPRAHYVVGVGLEMQGRLPEAAAAYEETLRRMPGHALARSRLAEVRAVLGSPAFVPEKGLR
jgi:protein O-mannosyl-transferase